MSRHRWLRTNWMSEQNHPYVEGARCVILRGLRDDGQMFAAWGAADGHETPEVMRKVLDGLLNDPALPFVKNADEAMRAKYRTTHKGSRGWVEEPEL